MHLNGPSPDESVDEWLGWSARLLHLCQGDPDERSEGRWIYNLPDGCSEIQSEITVVFERGVVTSAKVKNRHTGQHCVSEF